tara:strand:- start:1357 stop:3234 length:1878 start_codon:yes stop_codon:yes gene_type:complete
MDVESLAKQLILKGMTEEQQNAVLESIKTTMGNARTVQKQRIGENVQVVVQALKKIEADIKSRYDETGKAIEKRVASIKDGRDGRDGVDGRAGKDGRPGRDGAVGPRGIDGLNGSNGVDGVDGISITDAHIDFDGSLIITLSDGKLLNVGEVVSQDIAEKIRVIQTMSTNGAVGIKDEGSSISTGVKNINFVGATVTATNSGDDVTVNVSAGTGTVTSVAVSGGSTGLTTSGGPITTTGTITLAGTLAVASGGTGTATPGLIAGTNITSITGSWPNQTINAGGGSGTVTSVAATVPAFLSVTGSPITTSGTLAIGLSGSALPIANGGTGNATGTATINANLTGDVTSVGNASTLATVNSNVGSFTNANITVNAKGLITAAASGSPGGVTSVTATSPVASSGGTTPDISLASGYGDTLNPYASKTANFVLAAPNGTAGVPTFRAVVAADIPTLNQSTTGSAATLTTGRTIAVTGDLAYTSPSFDGSTNVTAAGTLATVNANVGSFTAANITVNAKGLITAASNGTAGATISNDTSTASNLYPLFAAATSGTPTTIYTSDPKYLYKPSTGELQASAVVASNGLVVNSNTVATSYSIPSGSSAMSAGPMSVSGGITVTIPSGSRWVVL